MQMALADQSVWPTTLAAPVPLALPRDIWRGLPAPRHPQRRGRPGPEAPRAWSRCPPLRRRAARAAPPRPSRSSERSRCHHQHHRCRPSSPPEAPRGARHPPSPWRRERQAGRRQACESWPGRPPGGRPGGDRLHPPHQLRPGPSLRRGQGHPAQCDAPCAGPARRARVGAVLGTGPASRRGAASSGSGNPGSVGGHTGPGAG
mmetsp:Transcript_86366/g.252748  ORF Transcript_86366/g.252748 Transcript_86366/m.252748 type:complete len:203 (+) Transcript_86366:779-1387(+)